MQRHGNWQGWVAMILAGLALMVALGDRVPWGRQSDSVQVVAQQAVQPSVREERPERGNHHAMRMMPGSRDDHVVPSMRSSRHEAGFALSRQPDMFGVFGMLLGVAQLIGLALLAWLLLRLFAQRRDAATPMTPAGHDPRVE